MRRSPAQIKARRRCELGPREGSYTKEEEERERKHKKRNLAVAYFQLTGGAHIGVH